MHAVKLLPNYIIIVYQLCHTLLCDVDAMPNWCTSQHSMDGVFLSVVTHTAVYLCLQDTASPLEVKPASCDIPCFGFL